MKRAASVERTNGNPETIQRKGVVGSQKLDWLIADAVSVAGKAGWQIACFH